jgi:hypothetical protein
MPVWEFPFEVFTIDMDLNGVFAGSTLPGWVLISWIIVMGTIVPYLFVIAGLRLLSASTSSVIGMLEPVLAGVFAWIWLQQSWNGIQLIGAAVVLVGVYIADRARSAAHLSSEVILWRGICSFALLRPVLSATRILWHVIEPCIVKLRRNGNCSRWSVTVLSNN